ncbi:response regulator [Patescibacteria group bacterium]|nr:response regulator [Patescibacteria group bacterium]
MEKEKKRILIIEDENALLEVLTDKFEEEGFSVLQARNGKEGLEIAINDKPDLILLDIIMPVMDGMTMLRELKKKQKGNRIPVIILTNLGAAEDVEQAIKEGAYDFLIKAEYKISDVVKKVEQILNKIA